MPNDNSPFARSAQDEASQSQLAAKTLSEALRSEDPSSAQLWIDRNARSKAIVEFQAAYVRAGLVGVMPPVATALVHWLSLHTEAGEVPDLRVTCSYEEAAEAFNMNEGTMERVFKSLEFVEAIKKLGRVGIEGRGAKLRYLLTPPSEPIGFDRRSAIKYVAAINTAFSGKKYRWELRRAVADLRSWEALKDDDRAKKRSPLAGTFSALARPFLSTDAARICGKSKVPAGARKVPAGARKVPAGARKVPAGAQVGADTIDVFSLAEASLAEAAACAEELKKTGAVKPETIAWLSKHPKCTVEQIKIAFERLVRARARNGVKTTDEGYMVDAIMKGYGRPATAAEKREASRPEHRQEENAAHRQTAASEAAQWNRDKAGVAALPPTEQDAIFDRAKNAAVPGVREWLESIEPERGSPPWVAAIIEQLRLESKGGAR